MPKQINIGIEDYKEVIDNNCYYADKTPLIKALLDHRHKVHFIMRPRRFGKTLALSMLQTFFEDARGPEGNKVDHRHYFEDKNIYSAGEKYLQYLGKYPVINMSLKSAKQPTFELAYHKICEKIANEFQRHRYILESDILRPVEKEKYISVMDLQADYGDYCTALELLSHYLERCHREQVIVLIDEYDVPLQTAHYNGFYEPMIHFIRSLFESVLKTNSSLLFGVVTGCLRISKESIFTGLNNLNESSVLDTVFSEYFGFTADEVEKLLEDYGLSSCLPDVKDWYNGYIFGKSEIYNPWSISKYVYEVLNGITDVPEAYWANTSSNDVIRDLISNSDNNAIRDGIEDLMNGKTIKAPLCTGITYQTILKPIDNVWSFLLFTGYLKKGKKRR